jgi:UDP-N-acetylmuramoyl-tripeptide--D-alanyl-D-alanine ligase
MTSRSSKSCWKDKQGRVRLVELNLNEIAQKTGGEILQGSSSTVFRTFNIDSRRTQQGELFFALIAQRNGHVYVPDAVQKGAAGAVISQKITLADSDAALIMVNDTLSALQKLAQKVLLNHPARTVGITGSIGKTTTKEFAASLLSKSFDVLKSEGNFNNHIGLPLSILRLTDSHTIAVLEMGMSAPGEISRLTQIAPPDVAVITNIHPVHLEFLKDMEHVAEAKKEILDGLKPEGIAILNGDDVWVKKISKDWNGEKLFFGLSKSCEIRASNIQRMGIQGLSFDLLYENQKERIDIPYFYTSFLYNFLAAVGVAQAFSTPLDALLPQIQTLRSFEMRGKTYRLDDDITLIDDSYNSNPAALESALKDLSELPAKRKVAVLGDMLELGKQEVRYHIQAGEQVKAHHWNILVTVGPLSLHMAEGAINAGLRNNCIFSYRDSEETADHIGRLLKAGDLVLVKGSRGMRTEKIVKKLREKGL